MSSDAKFWVAVVITGTLLAFGVAGATYGVVTALHSSTVTNCQHVNQLRTTLDGFIKVSTARIGAKDTISHDFYMQHPAAKKLAQKQAAQLVAELAPVRCQ